MWQVNTDLITVLKGHIDTRINRKYINNKKEGSLTIEASLVLPLFVIGIFSLISIGKIMSFRMVMQYALCEEVQDLSIRCLDGHNEAISTVRDDLLNILDSYQVGYSYVENGRDGIELDGSRLDNDEYIELVVSYVYKPLGADFLGIMVIPMSQSCVVHNWCGYIYGYFDQDDSEYVYITKDSNVYHLNRECSHIKLTIVTVDGDEVNNIRNENGAKYYRCSSCHSSENDRVLYVTTDGTKFHNSVTCSGLKRTVMAIKIANIGDRRPCKRCGR